MAGGSGLYNLQDHTASLTCFIPTPQRNLKPPQRKPIAPLKDPGVCLGVVLSSKGAKSTDPQAEFAWIPPRVLLHDLSGIPVPVSEDARYLESQVAVA